MNGMRLPETKPFYITQSIKEQLVVIAKMSKTSPQNILIKGMQGCGKTELAEQTAARLNRPYADFQVGLLNEPGQLFGQQILRTGNVEYQRFLFTDAIQVSNAIILLDEINRAQHPKALNDLYSVLDDRRYIWIDELGKTIRVAPGVIFFGTINEGAEFSGTDMCDAAMLDRFPYTIEMTVLPEEIERELLMARTGLDEKQAKRLASIYAGIRRTEVKLSTRKALAIGHLVQHGLNLRQAFIMSLSINRDELERVLVSIHLDTEEELGMRAEEWTML